MTPPSWPTIAEDLHRAAEVALEEAERLGESGSAADTANIILLLYRSARWEIAAERAWYGAPGSSSVMLLIRHAQALQFLRKFGKEKP